MIHSDFSHFKRKMLSCFLRKLLKYQILNVYYTNTSALAYTLLYIIFRQPLCFVIVTRVWPSIKSFSPGGMYFYLKNNVLSHDSFFPQKNIYFTKGKM